MGVPGNANALLLRSAAAAGGYQVSRSLRFNSSDSAYLSRTPASAGNRKTWTWAGWVKRNRSGRDILFGNFNAALTEGLVVEFGTSSTDNILSVQSWVGNSLIWHQYTTAVFRDFSSWYHVVIAHDTTQAASVDRVKLYVNGVLQGSANGTAPSLNYDSKLNTTEEHAIGRAGAGAFGYTSAYLADVFFIDGQALTPSSFTETSATTGQLIPKAYTGSFGTNGFWLKFSDNSAATATTLGKDYSGNSNNWTPNNLSVTAGAGNDSLVDTPTSAGTDTGVGGVVTGNYCTWNALDKDADVSLTNGNLDMSQSAAGSTLATIGASSGKWYWEVTAGTGSVVIGAVKGQSGYDLSNYVGQSGSSIGYNYNLGGIGDYLVSNVTLTGSGLNTYTSGDIIGVALDMDAGTIKFYKNGVLQGRYGTGLTGTWFPAIGSNVSTGTSNANFGQRPFAYPVSGFKCLCDTSLPAPLTAKPNTVMDVILYTGTGANATIPNVNTVPTSIAFTPDLVWIKGRSGATDHALYDSVRDVQKDLVSNSTAAETTQSTGLTAFGTNTFNIGTLAKLNTSSSTYVGWCWDAGSSTVTNTQGSITSSVRANASAGFSVVTFNSGSDGSVGHGLNAKPGLIIMKNRDQAIDWRVWHQSFSNPQRDELYLNLTNAVTTSGVDVWGASGYPNSTTFWFRYGSSASGGARNQVAYVFAPVAGYSSFGSYTGNGSASGDGPFVYTGFRPKWLMFKKSSASGDNWVIVNSAISPYNLVDQILYPNASDAQTPSGTLDFLSNGFKLRNDDLYSNQSGATYIYAAFAESPFQYARAR